MDWLNACPFIVIFYRLDLLPYTATGLKGPASPIRHCDRLWLFSNDEMISDWLFAYAGFLCFLSIGSTPFQDLIFHFVWLIAWRFINRSTKLILLREKANSDQIQFRKKLLPTTVSWTIMWEITSERDLERFLAYIWKALKALVQNMDKRWMTRYQNDGNFVSKIWYRSWVTWPPGSPRSHEFCEK